MSQPKPKPTGPRAFLDLKDMPQGPSYEDRYRQYLEVFERIAHTPATIAVTAQNAPWSWVPLLEHLHVNVVGPRNVFEHCSAVHGAMKYMSPNWDRTLLEVLCSFRPETADALWKVDMQWETHPGRVRTYEQGKEFIVTTNGAFHRREVLEYREHLKEYKPSKRKTLLVPCAADKPYPAPLHSACLSAMPKDFYLMNATGVVGLVPQDLWPVMPHYDSGIPNQWRLYETIRWYFRMHHHDVIVVYCDFYSETIQQAFRSIGQDNRVHYVLPVQAYDDYEDLLRGEWYRKLLETMKRLSP